MFLLQETTNSFEKMKKFYATALILFSVFNSKVNAQCVVDETEDSRGIYPAEFPTACVGSNYSESATVIGFADTVIFGFALTIDSMKINDVFGLPAGLSWVCGELDSIVVPAIPEPPRLCISVDGAVNQMFPETTVGAALTYYVTVPFVGPMAAPDTLYTTIGSSSVDTAVTVAGMTLISSASNATYQWLDCNSSMSLIPNETAPSYTSSVGGSFAVEVTQEGCTLVSECYNVSGLGFYDRAAESFFSVYPNPSSGQVSFQLTDNTNIDLLNIIGLDGKTVFSLPMKTMNQKVVSLELPVGVYTAQAIGEDGQISSQRIVISGK